MKSIMAARTLRGTMLTALAVALLAVTGARAQEIVETHGISAFGELKYPAGFSHFDYVDPAAPKGGTIRLHNIGTYDSLNPYILNGNKAIGVGLIYDGLVAGSADEPDAAYGLIAESMRYPEDRSWIEFTIRPEARWHDGVPITASDVVFSWNVLLEKGHPQYKFVLSDIENVEAVAERVVSFTFRDEAIKRDLPLTAGGLPVLPEHYYEKVEFGETTLEPPLGSGPYRIAEIDAGQSITYERVADYWAADLPVNRGRWNFERIRFDYYRDRNVAREGFFAGAYDYREEFTSKSWATEYDGKPAVERGDIVLATLDDNTPSGTQLFIMNLRLDKFQDPRVREALGLAFDFEWTNQNLFYGLYERTESMFENSELAAHMPPSEAELELLEPYRGQVPEEVFEKPYEAPVSDGSGRDRTLLRKAKRLLAEAGWTVQDGVLKNEAGEPFTLEVLMFESTFERIIAPFVENLRRLGIQAEMRLVDPTQFQNRMREYDYEMTTTRFGGSLTPGNELRIIWGSESAKQPGSPNRSGVSDPVVDELIEKVIGAEDREALITATRALDRVLMWNHYAIPQWYKGVHNIAYWDIFGMPGERPKYEIGYLDTWWYVPEKAADVRR